jgi:hypothetical protein
MDMILDLNDTTLIFNYYVQVMVSEGFNLLLKKKIGKWKL